MKLLQSNTFFNSDIFKQRKFSFIYMKFLMPCCSKVTNNGPPKKRLRTTAIDRKRVKKVRKERLIACQYRNGSFTKHFSSSSTTLHYTRMSEKLFQMTKFELIFEIIFVIIYSSFSNL